MEQTFTASKCCLARKWVISLGFRLGLARMIGCVGVAYSSYVDLTNEAFARPDSTHYTQVFFS
jgi:hypothetical protein